MAKTIQDPVQKGMVALENHKKLNSNSPENAMICLQWENSIKLLIFFTSNEENRATFDSPKNAKLFYIISLIQHTLIFIIVPLMIPPPAEKKFIVGGI